LIRIPATEKYVDDWLHNLPVIWMAGVVFGVTYLIAAAIYAVVMVLATGERARAFKAVSPGILSPLGVLFGLFVAFTAVQVWNDNDRANAAVDREASALREVVVLAASFPGEPQARLRALIRRHIEVAATQEWPMMVHRTAATMNITPHHLDEALQLTLALTPSGQGQQIAQREIATELGAALDARHQRFVVSLAEVKFVKWSFLFVQAFCVMIIIALMQSDNRLATSITMGVFATGVAASVVLILSFDRPFIGQLSVGPDSLLRVIPEAAALPVVAAPAAPSAPEAPAAAPPPINPLEKPASKPVAHAGGVASAVFPSEISPAHAGEQPSVARLKTCSEQYHANATTNSNGGLKWNSYRKECKKRLKS
jgi:Protein of unknown function (DUF4239)